MIEAPSYLGVQAIVNMAVSVGMIMLAFWALQSFKFDLFIKDTQGRQSRMLHVILAIAIGHTLARFVIDYIEWANWLRYLF